MVGRMEDGAPVTWETMCNFTTMDVSASLSSADIWSQHPDPKRRVSREEFVKRNHQAGKLRAKSKSHLGAECVAPPEAKEGARKRLQETSAREMWIVCLRRARRLVPARETRVIRGGADASWCWTPTR